MPMYDYKCEECGNVIEVFVKSMTIKPNLKCDKCGNDNQEKFEKLVSSGTSVKFKGSGWETNDNFYANTPHKNMDPSDVSGGGFVDNPSGYDQVLHKRKK